MSNWSTKKLGDICEKNGGNIRTGPFGTQLHKSDYQKEGIPVVNPQDLVDGNIDTSSVARVGKNHVERLSQHKLKEGDIIYARRGDIGRRAYITEREAGWLCGTGCLKIDTGNDELDSKFLFYYLGDEKVTEWIYNQAVGATMANLNTSILSDVTVEYPSVDYQKQIASILSAFDDLIENNSQRIEILEEMARRIYREWFVHFRYPGHEDDELVDSGTELGKIPDGWGILKTGDQFECILGGTPSRKKEEYWNNGSISWVNSGAINLLRIIEPSETITELGLDKSSAKLMPVKSTLIAITGATLGQVSFNEIVTAANQSVVGIVDREKLYREWLYLTFQERIQELVKQSSGGAHQHINKGIVEDFKLVIPSSFLVKKFQMLIEPIFHQIKLLLFKNKNLKETRDLLLPKIISGKIDVEKIPT